MCAMIPFWGTVLGSGFVFFAKKGKTDFNSQVLNGISAGVMLGACVWSLLVPSVEKSKALGVWSFLPCVLGFSFGMLFMLVLERLTFSLQQNSISKENRKNLMSFLAVTVHNFPEGMAVGAIVCSYLYKQGVIPMSAYALPFGIALQNIPEGAIISLPLHYSGKSKKRAFFGGVISGVVEPVGAFLTVLLSVVFVSLLPFSLSFAAGAMVFVVVTQLALDFYEENCPYKYIISFTLGFSVMTTLDVILS